ncbi:hypothetical protein [Streptomyces sp. NBC_00212]|uniref:hypothetical protein n=1 Tax=Streptomyces sp. NBC_00212 TaxID=2975684 RepID=UPI003251DAA6
MSPIRRFVSAAASLALATAGLAVGTGMAHAAAHAAPATAASGACSQSYMPLPDPACQPGADNPDVTQDTIASTICVSGWTSMGSGKNFGCRWRTGAVLRGVRPRGGGRTATLAAFDME